MCHTNQSMTLTESDDLQITWCRGCNNFSLCYKCCCASFTEKELRQFINILQDIDITRYDFDFNGKPHVIIHRPCSYIGFCLNQVDIEVLIQEISESLNLYEAYKVIYA